MTVSLERDQLRKIFYEAWRKQTENLLTDPLESMIIEIILLHPEYYDIFDQPEKLSEITSQETNPFLHLSLHLAIREQISINRPQGIKAIYENLCKKFQDTHLAEHQMLKYLEQTLWDAQQAGHLPDEQYYLAMLRKIG